MMREITNTIFECLTPIWKDGTYKSPQMKETYKKVNNLLVETFSTILKKIEADGYVKETFKENVVNSTKERITFIFTTPVSC